MESVFSALDFRLMITKQLYFFICVFAFIHIVTIFCTCVYAYEHIRNILAAFVFKLMITY